MASRTSSSVALGSSSSSSPVVGSVTEYMGVGASVPCGTVPGTLSVVDRILYTLVRIPTWAQSEWVVRPAGVRASVLDGREVWIGLSTCGDAVPPDWSVFL